MQTSPILKHIILRLFVGFLIFFNLPSLHAQFPINEQNELKITEILSQMTLAEKIGQMTQVTLDVISKTDSSGKVIEPHEIDPDKLKEVLLTHHVGSILNVGAHTFHRTHWHEIISTIQTVATQESNIKIPVIYGIDAIHGVTYTEGSTLFPQQIGMAATWNPELVKKAGAVTAYETRASGIPWNFSPVLDLARQPLWSRFFETFGSDVYLAKQMSEAILEGYQGDDPADPYRVGACLKHFAGYSMPLSGKDRTPAWIPERYMKEYFLPTFETAIKKGALTVMVNSGDVNGIPGHANHQLLTELLKNEWGFKGFAVSDWEDFIMLHTTHKMADSEKEAVKIAIMAGMDMSMVPLSPQYQKYQTYLLELVASGDIPESRIDESVRRILRVKMDLGLFKTPVPNPKKYPEFASKASEELNLQMATESITLLKNANNLLPLQKSSNVLVTGPTANNLIYLNGSWTHTWQGNDPKYNTPGKLTVLEAIQNKSTKNVTFIEGSKIDEPLNLEEAEKAAQNVDAVIICLGENPSTEKPGDIQDLNLPQAQIALVKVLKEAGKPIILVLLESRPRIIHEIVNDCDAILMGYLPGNEGGKAIANLLFGDADFSGRLPFTYPSNTGDFVQYDHKFTETKDKDFGYNAYHPEFDFGSGLSYTSFSYTNLSLNKSEIGPEERVEIKVTVTNTGKRKGKEVVQLYVSDNYASITPSVKRLRAFEKIELNPGESRNVVFSLPAKELAFVDLNNKWRVEKGDFTVRVNTLKAEFKVNETLILD